MLPFFKTLDDLLIGTEQFYWSFKTFFIKVFVDHIKLVTFGGDHELLFIFINRILDERHVKYFVIQLILFYNSIFALVGQVNFNQTFSVGYHTVHTKIHEDCEIFKMVFNSGVQCVAFMNFAFHNF